jgi:hypothetical protein
MRPAHPAPRIPANLPPSRRSDYPSTPRSRAPASQFRNNHGNCADYVNMKISLDARIHGSNIAFRLSKSGFSRSITDLCIIILGDAYQ